MSGILFELYPYSLLFSAELRIWLVCISCLSASSTFLIVLNYVLLLDISTVSQLLNLLLQCCFLCSIQGQLMIPVFMTWYNVFWTLGLPPYCARYHVIIFSLADKLCPSFCRVSECLLEQVCGGSFDGCSCFHDCYVLTIA